MRARIEAAEKVWQLATVTPAETIRLLGGAPPPTPQPVKALPLVDCFCGRWHFLSDGSPLRARSPDGTVHTPDACGRFDPAPLPGSLRSSTTPRYVTVRYTMGEGSTKAEIVPVADPEQAPLPALVSCSCGVAAFDRAYFPPGHAMRVRFPSGSFHAPEGCLDKTGHPLRPSAGPAGWVPCYCRARKVSPGQELSALEIIGVRDIHSPSYCADAAGRVYAPYAAPALEHP